MRHFVETIFCLSLAVGAFVLTGCGGDGKQGKTATYVDADGNAVSSADEGKQVVEGLPYSGEDALEMVYDEYGTHTIRLVKDKSLSFPDKVKKKDNCFVVMSKKDYYLYVYEPQGDDTVMVARYDCCFALKKGNKQKSGDMRTPHTTMDNPFTITEIKDASTWDHDFGDGRGPILSYGHWFHRLDTHGHKGIGIHGSTNNAGSVPGRASEGCIRLLDADIIDFKENYAHVGMKVVIKAEDVDDLPFEINAIKKQGIERKRHLDPKKCLTNEQVEAATPVETISKSGNKTEGNGKNKTLEELGGSDGESTSGEPSADARGVDNPGKNQTLEQLQGK